MSRKIFEVKTMQQEVKDIINEMKQSDFIELTYNIEEVGGQEFIADVTSRVDDYKLVISKGDFYYIYVQDSNTGFCTHANTRAANLAQLRYFLKENGMTVLFDVAMLSKINQEYISPKRKFL